MIKSEQCIPTFVIGCIEEIERRGLLDEGIYRICGSNNDIKAIKTSFEECRFLLILIIKQINQLLLKKFFNYLYFNLTGI